MNEAEIKLKKGQRIAWIATGITLLLSLLKGIVGVSFGAKVLVADAFHSGADAIAIFASGFGLWLASRKKSATFPYGLFKAETFITLLIGGFIFWAGIELLIDGYHKLFERSEFESFPYLPVAVSTLSILTAFFIARKEKSIGQEINSQSLLANAGESYLDIWSSIVVLLGIVLTYFRIRYVEGAIIIFISLLILKLGFENIRLSLLVLLDANIDVEIQEKIRVMVAAIYGVNDVIDIKIRQAGPFRMVELEFSTNPSLTIYRAHEIADEIERKIQAEFENIESVFVHIEPSVSDTIFAILPVREMNGLDSKVFGHFGRSPYYVILRLTENDIQIEDFYLNEFLARKKHIGLNVVKVIIHYGLDMLFTSQIGEISFYMLKENFIDLYQIPDENLTVRQIISQYRENKLGRITTPTHSVDDALISESSDDVANGDD